MTPDGPLCKSCPIGPGCIGARNPHLCADPAKDAVRRFHAAYPAPKAPAPDPVADVVVLRHDACALYRDMHCGCAGPKCWRIGRVPRLADCRACLAATVAPWLAP